MRVAELFAAELASGRVSIRGGMEREVTDMVIDSRKVGEGALFAALAGPGHDGHAFVDQALAAGASALLVTRGRGPARCRAAVVETDDVREALGPAADRFFGSPSERMDVFGVTGTNGKTSVTTILEAILKASGKAAGIIGTIEYHWKGIRQAAPCTTPEAVDLHRILQAMADDGVTAAAMEVSSHALAQKRVKGCRFRAAVFTNLSRDHLDYHTHMDEYFEAKSLLFSSYGAPMRIANGDDPWGKRLVESCRGTLSFGLAEGNDYRAVHPETGPRGSAFDIEGPGGPVRIESKLVGRHNIYNILAAAGVALACGISGASVRTGVASVETIPGRFETVAAAEGPLVLVDYAHTPDALREALSGARGLTAGRLIVVFGCGGDRDRGKRPLMGEAAAQLADVTWLTSDNPRSEKPAAIIDETQEGFEAAVGGGGELYVEEDRRKAIAGAVASACPEDLILIAGKGHEDYQELAGGRVPFSDRLEAARALEMRKR